MGADSEDEDDYVYVGTPLDAPPPGPHRAGAATAATKNLPVWKQTPTDERGRPRFHGTAATALRVLGMSGWTAPGSLHALCGTGPLVSP